ERSHRHPGSPAAQPQEPGPGSAAPRGDRGHGAVGVGEVVARLRHGVRGGAAQVRGVAFHVRQAVPRPDGEAGRGPRGRHLARGGHRAAQPHQDVALHRGHGDRGVRLPAPAVGAGGPHLLPRPAPRRPLRPRDPPGQRADGHRRHAGPPGRHPRHGVLPPAVVGARDARAGGGEPARPGLRARAGGRRRDPPGRASRGRGPDARRRAAGGGGPRQGGCRAVRPPGRLAGHRVHGGGGRGRGGARGNGAAALHRPLPLPGPPADRVRHPVAAALLVQQPVRELPGVHRLRRRAAAGRVADRLQPRPVAGRGRGGSLADAALRGQAEEAGRPGPQGGRLRRHALAGSPGGVPAQGAARGARLPGGARLLRGAGGEALQGVHPRLHPPVPERAHLPAVRGRQAAPRGVAGEGGRAHHRRGVGDAAGPPAPLGRDTARSAPQRRRRLPACPPFRAGAGDRGDDPQGAGVAHRLPERRGAGIPDAGAADAHPFRRRGAAHLAVQRAGEPAGGYAVRAGRAHHRPAPGGQRPAAVAAGAPARGRQHRAGGGARPRGHAHRRPPGGAGAGERRAGRPPRVRGHARRDHAGRHHHRPLPFRPRGDRRAGAAARHARSAAAHRGRPRAQPARRGRGDPPGRADGGERRVRLGEEHARARRPLPRAGAGAVRGRDLGQAPHGRRGGRVRPDERHRGHPRGGAGGPEPHRAHPPLQSGHLHQGLGRGEAHLRLSAGRGAARVHPRALLVQRHGRALRGVQGRGAGGGGDGLHGGRLRSLRDLRRRALQAGRAGGAVQGAQRARRAGDDHRPGDPLLHPRRPAGPGALAPAAGGARLPAPGPARPHPVRRRSTAHQGCARAGAGRAARRQEAVHPGRAHHRPAHGRHSQAPARAGRPGGRGAHGGPDRAQPGRDQDGRLGDRPGPRRRPRRRARGGDGDPGGGGGGGGERHGALPRAPAGEGRGNRL
ncbi:MAG: Excinuclease ABC subunit A, partial [uncultured Gemmatimonadetes bacterium]